MDAFQYAEGAVDRTQLVAGLCHWFSTSQRLQALHCEGDGAQIADKRRVRMGTNLLKVSVSLERIAMKLPAPSLHRNTMHLGQISVFIRDLQFANQFLEVAPRRLH